uniref:Uncharacterized protein n=1 Tax=Rhizophora mucronata TaxID=61149 RepID=A0A2P2IHM0_RHIMU
MKIIDYFAVQCRCFGVFSPDIARIHLFFIC